MLILKMFPAPFLLTTIYFSNGCDAFSSPNLKNIISDTVSSWTNNLIDLTGGDGKGVNEKPLSTLEELGLESSTEPKKFGVASFSQLVDVLMASFPVIFRAGYGIFAQGYGLSFDFKSTMTPNKDQSKSSYKITIGNLEITETCSEIIPLKQPKVPLEFYEFEQCPFCRKVREAVSILCLRVVYKPCPKNGPRFRKEIKDQYGKKATFPYMYDPNTGIKMFESDDIIQYLFTAYGDGKVPIFLRLGGWTTFTAGLGLLPRAFKGGGTYKTSTTPPVPLILYAYEGSPFSKLVKEELCALELEYMQISCPRGSPYRQELFEKTGGTVQFPYLEDPYKDVKLFESAAIIEYLRKMYSVEPSPIEYL